MGASVQFLLQFQQELWSLGTTVFLALAGYFLRPRVKLLWATSHGFVFVLPNPAIASAQNANMQVPPNLPPSVNIHTASLVVGNDGRVSATDVEITLNWKPENLNLWPARQYSDHTAPDQRYTLRFNYLAPKEQVQLEMIAPTSLPAVVNVRCLECLGKQIPMRPMRVYPRWVAISLLGTILLGIAALIYIVLRVVSAL